LTLRFDPSAPTPKGHSITTSLSQDEKLWGITVYSDGQVAGAKFASGRQEPSGLNQTFAPENLGLLLYGGRFLIELIYIQGGDGHGRAFGEFAGGRDATGGTEDHEFGVVFLRALTFEKIAEDGDIAEAGDLVRDGGHAVIDEARDYEALAVLQLELGIGFACAERGNRCSGDSDGIGVIQRAYFGRD